ncbi:hypothetical protein Mapa_007049 [Marchantia paleacea]|nr:hypothetical protein Mapa_007049 [Marchantia paleacea]
MPFSTSTQLQSSENQVWPNHEFGPHENSPRTSRLVGAIERALWEDEMLSRSKPLAPSVLWGKVLSRGRECRRQLRRPRARSREEGHGNAAGPGRGVFIRVRV